MDNNEVPRSAVIFSVFAFGLFSSLATVANKVCISHLPLPGLVFCLQLAVTVVFIRLARAFGFLEADGLEPNKVKIFMPYICSFAMSLYSNGRALAAANIETVIVFRALSPLCVSVLDWAFLGRELPSARSALVLLGMVAGAVGYVLCDSQFKVSGLMAYKWVTISLCGIVFEMTYGKRLMSGIEFESPVWGSVLYTNVLSLPPMLAMAVSTGEHLRLRDDIDSMGSLGGIWLFLSCVVGVGISWAGWNCRSKVSATSLSLLAVVAKLLSVIVNVLIWDKHATPPGLAMLTVTILCSSVYRQAPLRSERTKSTPDVEESSDGVAAAVNGSSPKDSDEATTTLEALTTHVEEEPSSGVAATVIGSEQRDSPEAPTEFGR